MTKNNLKIITICISSLISCYILLLILSNVYWMVIAIGSSPQIADKIESRIANESSAKLISRLNALDNPFYIDNYSPYPIMSLKILSNRREASAVPVLLNLLRSKNSAIRINAISALNHIGDPRAIKPLLEMIKTRTQSDPDYFSMLDALSRFRCEQIYPEIIKMVTNKNLQMSAIDMLENYPKKGETQLALQQIAETNPSRYVRDMAHSALEKIKQDKGLKKS